MKRFVCVYCGAKVGTRAVFAETARAMGRRIGERGLGLVYGGGQVGLMGVLADAALAAGAEVVGVIPRALATQEVAHWGLSDLVMTDGLHARKARMTLQADAFVALPGGFGTLDELFEALTWRQLGLHEKPVGLLNVEGYFDGLLKFLQGAVREGFLTAELARLPVSTDPDALLDALL